MLSCKDVCENATIYIDGMHLDGKPGLGNRLGLRFHLLLCRDCRRFIRQFQAMLGATPSLGAIDEPSIEEIDALAASLSAFNRS